MSNISLFEPSQLNDLELENKIVMASMTRSRCGNAEHTITELTAEYIEKRFSTQSP
ncbi:hypothetical protein [Chryseobacterium glaciei]|uniref:oxidoreductase n=1 Tax=Chryseobacterium glaciei TaxID=1685010 RepID=UPI000AD9737A